MITSLHVFGLTLMFMLGSPVWAAPTAPTVNALPCKLIKCTPTEAFRQAVNCFCGGTFTRVSIVSGRVTRPDLRPGDQAVRFQLNSRILGTGSQYLITSDPILAARLCRGFTVNTIKSIRGRFEINLSFTPLVR